LAGLMPADETQLLYSICLHGRGELGLAPDEYAALTMVLLRLLAFKPATAQAAPAEKKTLTNPVIEVPQPAPVLVATPVSLPPTVAQAAPLPTPARVQPWEDEPNQPSAPVEYAQAAIKDIAKPAPVVSAPPGQQVPVVSLPRATVQPPVNESNQPPAPVDHAQAATNIVAIPVRVQADSRMEAMAGHAAATVLQPTPEGDFWHQTVQQLIATEAITALVRVLALQSQLVARDTDQWILRVESASLNQSGTRERLTTALQAAGHSVQLVVEVGRVTDSPAQRNLAAAAECQLAAEKIIFNDPFVQTMMQNFGAKIVAGSIKPG
jgi:DNA polymerase-3 subunit gamma/tau